jgi:hypothetical protein
MRWIIPSLLCGFFFLGLARVPAAVEVKGVEVPETLNAGETLLMLNGAGIGERFFVDLFVGCLYLKEPSSDAESIIKADEPMAIRLHVLSPLVTSRGMIEGTRRGFRELPAGGGTGIEKEIDLFLDPFRPDIRVGDTFDLIYRPALGVEIWKNGRLSSLASGQKFKRGLFEIWLGDRAAYPSLKPLMLGR